MKASTPIFKILSAVMLAAVVVYFSVQAYRYFTDPINTTVVYAAAEEVVMEVNGYLIRDEETFHSDAGTLSHTLSEGERVGKGQTMAVAYADSGALTRVEQLEALKLKKEQLSFSLVSYLDPDAALKLDSSINSDILALRQSVAGGEYGSAEEQLTSLKGAILKRDYTSESQEEIEANIKATEQEISEMERSLNGTAVTAPGSGIYSAVCDGYETVLTTETLTELTPSKLSGLRPKEGAQANVGKLIYGDRWYYAAPITDAQAQQLGGRTTVTLRFAKGLTMDLQMTVPISPPVRTAAGCCCCKATNTLPRPPCCAIRPPRWCCAPMRDCACRPTRCASTRRASAACTVCWACGPSSSRCRWYIRAMAMRWWRWHRQWRIPACCGRGIR